MGYLYEDPDRFHERNRIETILSCRSRIDGLLQNLLYNYQKLMCIPDKEWIEIEKSIEKISNEIHKLYEKERHW